MERYRAYSTYLQQKYGSKVYKLPLNLPGTCPNRDGVIGRGGCIYCDEAGAGFECLPASYSIREQVARNKESFARRYGATRFIPYFQAFTNTYWPLEQFQEFVLAACEDRDVVGLSISTRPDCIHEAYLAFLQELKKRRGVDIDIEIGLQTVNYHTLRRINRGHTLAEFIDAVLRIKKYGLAVCVHIILNLPWDNVDDVIENAKVLSALMVDYVKLHSLYVVENTVLGEMYRRGQFDIISLDEYARWVVTFLEYLHPQIVIQRLVGRGPYNQVLFCNWGTSWWQVKQRIERLLEEMDTWQGRYCDYLNGAALRRAGYVGEDSP